MVGTFHEVYDQRLVGLSVQGKKISGLQERFNITMNFTTTINVTPDLIQYFTLVLLSIPVYHC